MTSYNAWKFHQFHYTQLSFLGTQLHPLRSLSSASFTRQWWNCTVAALCGSWRETYLVSGPLRTILPTSNRIELVKTPEVRGAHSHLPSAGPVYRGFSGVSVGASSVSLMNHAVRNPLAVTVSHLSLKKKAPGNPKITHDSLWGQITCDLQQSQS